jgi:hypothetical protein
MEQRSDKDHTGITPAGGQQHGDSSGAGGNVDAPSGKRGHHPRPDTPESKVEHQADQPGVTTDAVADRS